MTSTAEMSSREQARQRLAREDAAAWQRYAEACHERVDAGERERLYVEARGTLDRLRDFERAN